MFPASGNHEYETADAAPFRAGVRAARKRAAGRARALVFVRLGRRALRRARHRADRRRTGRLAGGRSGRQPPALDRRLRAQAAALHRRSRRRRGFRQFFVPILEAHDVDLVLAGHDHHYERFTPQNGVTYVVSGGGGKGTRDVSGGPLTAFAEAVIHCVVVEVQGRHADPARHRRRRPRVRFGRHSEGGGRQQEPDARPRRRVGDLDAEPRLRRPVARVLQIEEAQPRAEAREDVRPIAAPRTRVPPRCPRP